MKLLPTCVSMTNVLEKFNKPYVYAEFHNLFPKNVQMQNGLTIYVCSNKKRGCLSTASLFNISGL